MSITHDNFQAGFYYACGRNDAGGEYVCPITFGTHYADHRGDDALLSWRSVQDFYRDFPR